MAEEVGDTVAGRFWMCLRTVHQMLQDRGYAVGKVPQYAEVASKLRFLDLADTERAQALMDQFEMCVKSTYNESSQICVFWLCGKIGVNSESVAKIQKMFPIAGLEEEDAATDDDEEAFQLGKQIAVELFLWLISPLTAQANKGTNVDNPPDTIILIQVENCTITPPARKIAAKIPAIVEIFDCEDLKRNVTQHRLQPKFRVLSQAEAEALKRKYCATNEQLPKMRWDDPVRRYFGLRVGQVIQCVRMADGGKDVYQRIVEAQTVVKKK